MLKQASKHILQGSNRKSSMPTIAKLSIASVLENLSPFVLKNIYYSITTGVVGIYSFGLL